MIERENSGSEPRMEQGIEGNLEQMSAFELSRIASQMLDNAGFSIWGRGLREDSGLYFQSRFEERMQTGAYGKNGERSR